MKTCSKCKEEKELTEFYKDKSKKSGVMSQCKLCRKDKPKYIRNTEDKIQSKRISCKKYREKNKEKISSYYKKYFQKNKQRINKNRTQYKKNRSKIDNVFKLRISYYKIISRSFAFNSHKKNTKTTEILGCEIDFFKEYIESKFLKGMSWDNRSEWHLDHIIPISSAKTEEDVIRLNHYTNFRPLWAKENIQKSNKIVSVQLALI